VSAGAVRSAGAWRRRGDMILRVVAAMPLGYAVATWWAMALSLILPMRPENATGTGMLAAFVICAVAAMWSFAARSGWRAFWTLAALGGVAGGIIWLATLTGGGQ